MKHVFALMFLIFGVPAFAATAVIEHDTCQLRVSGNYFDNLRAEQIAPLIAKGYFILDLGEGGATKSARPLELKIETLAEGYTLRVAARLTDGEKSTVAGPAEASFRYPMKEYFTRENKEYFGPTWLDLYQKTIGSLPYCSRAKGLARRSPLPVEFEGDLSYTAVPQLERLLAAFESPHIKPEIETLKKGRVSVLVRQDCGLFCQDSDVKRWTNTLGAPQLVLEFDNNSCEGDFCAEESIVMELLHILKDLAAYEGRVEDVGQLRR